MPLYKLTSPSGKSYVGITTGDVRRRMARHRLDARRGESTPLYKAIRKYGFEAFELSILDQSNDKGVLVALETEAILTHNTFGEAGYNLTLGGEGRFGSKMTDAHKTMLAEARAKRNGEMTDKERVEEKALRSASSKLAAARSDNARKSASYDHARRIAEARANRTPDQIAAEKANRSAAAKARWDKPGHREKVSIGQAATFATEEFKSRRSIASKAAWSESIRTKRANRTPEQIAAEKANRSAAVKARWDAGNFRKENI